MQQLKLRERLNFLVLDAYGVQIFGITFLVIIILLVSIILNLRSKRQLIIQMKDTRYYHKHQMNIYMSII